MVQKTYKIVRTDATSLIDYAISVWRPHYQKDIVQLEQIQHRATKNG